MEWLERMPAGNPGASSSSVRGLPDNPAQGRRPVPNSAATSNGLPPPPPPPPIPNLRNTSSNAALSASGLITSAAQVIGLAREAMLTALESEGQAAEAGAVSTALRAGVTVDLSRKGIQKLPEEVIDIVKGQLERGNLIKEFPIALCDLTSLEILDLGRNQLRMLPQDIARLSSLKVLSVPKNQIRELPLCLADMASLQVLKFEGNPISFPPKDAIQPQAGSPPHDGVVRETEVTEVAVTATIKKFLRHYAMTGRMEGDATGDESSEGGIDAPRFHLRRAASGRFPIKVNGADVPDLRSPNGLSRPPPIPTRSHYRGLSQQSTAIRRPGVMPLTIGNVSERLRSNSETLLRSDRGPDGRSRRMGIVSRKPSELGTLDETQANNRFSHYRGLSHGSAMQGAPQGVKSPATPNDPYLQRPVYVRRLSVLPERRRESKTFDPVIEAAKGVLYSVFQIHPMIQMLMTLTSDGSAKRSSLEIVFYNTNSHVEELEQEIQRHDMTLLEIDQYSAIDNENVHRACHTLVSAYGHVCTLLAENIDTFVNNGDARYIRTLLMLLYNSIMELRVTLTTVGASRPACQSTNRSMPDASETIKPFQREPFATPTADRVGLLRNRNGTVVHNPANLRVATDLPMHYAANGSTRTAKLASATPRSGGSSSSAGSRDLTNDYAGDDAQFEKVFVSLQRSTDIVLRILPSFHSQLQGKLRAAMQQRAPMALVQDWKHLVGMCGYTIQQTEILRNRLSLMKLNDPSVRSHPGFWSLCNNFVNSWMSFIKKTKGSMDSIPMPPDTRMRLRPIQQGMKEFGSIIVQSPWHHLMRSSAPNGSLGGAFAQGASPTTQAPITPQSAALGPALQATVSTTPHSASFAAAFQGNVFDRADALMANPGISMSRSGTMTRGHSGFNSLSSISSMSSDGISSVSTPFSPPNGGLGLSRLNGGRLAL
ncbi:RAM signaling pathway, SOG2 [Metarhizium album ARSEF 1941]|uniref:RAM signaling pathway, SOG2 n=1 Tax=Metarhizium album (strain ARSEF 1941) TaxID=1081103 RepID=A0A0B2WQS1_METAS|nr:RAM signaling pathway, SOG2 [Metarhizium album ARSEF 1941]KHN95837.1 RAM signaling pathway, SOG2 [Metarhizium album ARSEF 1941]